MIKDKKYIKFLFWLIFGFLLFMGYWKFTNYVQAELLYPWNKDSFHYSIFQSYVPSECFHIEPNYLTFDNKRGVFEVSTAFEKRCNFTHSIVWFTIKDMDYYHITNEENLSINQSRNMTDPNRLRIIVNASDMKPHHTYSLLFRFKLKNDFYNFFRLLATGTSIQQFKVMYKGNLKGYFCEQDCFTILKGNIDREESMWRGVSKKFRFNNADHILIKSSPKSKWWFFWQRIADTIILGIMVIIVYNFFNIIIDNMYSKYKRNKNSSKRKAKKNKRQ